MLFEGLQFSTFKQFLSKEKLNRVKTCWLEILADFKITSLSLKSEK